MKLKILNIDITSTGDFLKNTRQALKGKGTSKKQNQSLSFDSIETFKKVFTTNRLEILMAIAREKPLSIYQLAKFLDREHHHVVKDCKGLEIFGFITLEEAEKTKKQFVPRLSFDYDFIRVNGKMEEFFSISAKSNEVIARSIA